MTLGAENTREIVPDIADDILIDEGDSRDFGGRGRRDGGARNDMMSDRNQLGPMEVMVDHSLDKAMRVLKRKLIREGILRELKARRYFEKPCERKKRKNKESMKKRRKEESRVKKFFNQFS